jgi:sensor histidine kinase YesM
MDLPMRKRFNIFLLLFFITGKCCSQEQAAFIFDLQSLRTKNGGKLDNGWKFHAGDNIAWAKVEYDDTSWELVNPTLPLYRLPAVQEAGIGWFRLKIIVDSAFFNERIAMVITTQGASEIYLNGALQYKLGIVSSNYKKEQTRVIDYWPFSVKLGNQAIQELAVRYSFHHKNMYIHVGDAHCMQLVLYEHNKAFTDYIRHAGFYENIRSIQLSFYLPLGFLLLFFYFSYRLKKEYLYTGIFSFCMFCGAMLQILAHTGMRSVNVVNFYFLLQQACWVFGLVVFLRGSFLLLGQRISRLYYLIVLYALLIIPALLSFYDWSNLFAMCFTPVVIIEFLRISIKALRERRVGALILVITGIFCLLLMIGTIGFNITGKGEWAHYCYSLTFILPPIGLSLFFAGEFARTGLALHSRLAEVEKLSLKTLAQEKEKQQILALQNKTLEAQMAERTSELIEQRQSLEKEKEAKLLAEFNRRFSESELKALRSQMNPHFVFNILNTIESYALENNKDAVSMMIQKFSRLTRLVLENSMSQLVLFQNDWKSLQLYVELEQMRYPDSFSVVYTLEKGVMEGEYYIPPMIIQPFVENAIIHGLRNKPDHCGMLHLSACLRHDYIIVEVQDNGIGRVKAAALKDKNSLEKKSLGIKVTHDRIAIFNNINQHKKAKVAIEDLSEGTKVTIAVPVNWMSPVSPDVQ